MRTPSIELFELIKSLSKHEKRYFKLYTGQYTIGDKNNSLILFDFLEKQEKYDERELKEYFKNESFAKQIYVAKNRLFDLLLKSLHAYYSEASFNAYLDRLLHFVEILYNRELYKECNKTLKKAKLIAVRQEKFEHILRVLSWEEKMLFVEKEYRYPKLIQYLNEILNQKEEAIKNIQAITAVSNLFNELSSLVYAKGISIRSNEHRKTLKDIKNRIILFKEKAKTQTERINLEISLTTCYFVSGDYKNSYQAIKNAIRLIEKNEFFLKENIELYPTVLNNSIKIMVGLKKYKDALDVLPKFDKLLKNLSNYQKDNIGYETEARVVGYKLLIYYKMGETNHIKKSLEEAELHFHKYHKNIKPEVLLWIYYYVALCYFAIKQYEKSLEWTLKIFKDFPVEFMQDRQSMVRILNLIIHYELGNELLLPYSIKSTERYFKKIKYLFSLEKITLEMLQELINIAPLDRKKRDTALKYYLQLLNKNSFDETEKNMLEEVVLMPWIQSKIKGKTLCEVIKLS